jgi:ABC-type transporter Mla MlaB component
VVDFGSPASWGDGPPAVIHLVGRVDRESIPALCRRLRAVLERLDLDVVVCDVHGLESPCLAAVDALASLQLAAQEQGRCISLRGPTRELLDLIELAGLSGVLGTEGDARTA